MSDSIHHLLYLVAEATYGTTPATPELTQVRHTSCSLALSKESFRSNEINSTRNLQDFRHGNQQIGGEIGVEISAGTYDTLLQALLMGTWNANVLKIGQTRRSFSFIRNFIDQVTVGQKGKHAFTGVEMNKLSLKLVAGKVIEGSFGVIGQDVTYSDDLPVDYTTAGPTTTRVMDAFTGSATVDGDTYGITELMLTIENGLTPNFVLFSPYTELPSNQLCSVSGEIGLRFRSAALLELFLAGTQVELQFQISDGAKTYTFLLPKIMLNGGQPDVGGEGPINIKVPFTAVYDSATGSSIQITRVP